MNKRGFKEFKDSHPIGQSTHTGGWGWERVNGCLDLNRCVFRSERAAQLDRAKAYAYLTSMAELRDLD